MKRNLIIIVIIFLAAVGGFYYFTKDDVNFSRDSSVYKAIPVTTPFFIEFNSINAFDLKNPALNALNQAGLFTVFFTQMQHADSLIMAQEQIPKTLKNEPFIIAFDFTGRSEIVPIFIKKIDNNNEQDAMLGLLHAVYPQQKFSYTRRDYSQYEINEISAKENENATPVFFTFSDGLFVASHKSILVEQAIRQLSAKGVLNNPYFKRVNKSVTAQSEISLYVQHGHFPNYLKNLLNGQNVKSVNELGEAENRNYRRAIQSFADFAAWSEFDIQLKNDQISLAGISAADDSLNHFLSVFNEQEPVRFNADEVLPKNTSFFCSYAFSDKDKFFNRLEDYFMHSDFYYQREEMVKKMEMGFRADLRNTLQEIVKNEVIVASATIPVNPDDKTSYFIVHTEGANVATEKLKNLLTAYASRKEITLKDLESEYSIDNELKYTFYKFPYPSLPGIWLGKPFGFSQAGYVVVYENYLVFSNSEKGLQEYLHAMALDATLTNDMRYMRFKQKTSNRTNINVYADINRSFSLTRHLISDELNNTLEESEEEIRKFWAINWQVERSKDVYFNSVMVGFNENAREEAQTTWQSSIGSQINFKPQIMENHNNPDNREIVLQDELNKIYQVTSEGRIQWSVQLPGKIMSEIHQIDYYKNGKLQYLFNTKEKLWLLDRNGNNVAHFPIDLRSPATNGVNVFDYENSRNYRYFIAGEDRKIYAYDYSGKLVSGWEFDKTDHSVTTPVQHFRIGRKDYIVFKDKLQIYILDRRGQTRVGIAAQFENSSNPLLLNLDGLPKIVASDINGQVYYIYFNGKYEVKDVGKFSSKHFFTCDDLDGNGVPDFVFVDGYELDVRDENGKRMFREKFDSPVHHLPNIYNFGPKMKKVGIVEADAGRIYLFNPDGKLHDGFPLQGNSEFSIGVITENSGQLNLVVGSEDGNLFNYTLN
ncbi:MAG TPA: hypothetical protein VKA10_01065 [Prolixibacteraceae bacterium]|nr:hypothetical protein [Prolixibacteraceae bacterium]